MTKRMDWPLEQWAAFAERCQSVRERLYRLSMDFPDTQGLTPKPINHVMKAHGEWVSAMIKAESVLADQHGEEVGVIRSIHGTSPGRMLAGCRGRVGRDAPTLGRQQWADWGKEIKAIRAEISAVALEFQDTRGATKPLVSRFFKAAKWLDRAKWGLEAIVERQHPLWGQSSQCFNGPTDPIINDEVP